jgi:hypothetical protein
MRNDLDIIIEHIKYGNLQHATEALKHLKVKTIAKSESRLDLDLVQPICELVALKYGTDEPFKFGLSILLHNSKNSEEATILFKSSLKENEDGEKKTVKPVP